MLKEEEQDEIDCIKSFLINGYTRKEIAVNMDITECSANYKIDRKYRKYIIDLDIKSKSKKGVPTGKAFTDAWFKDKIKCRNFINIEKYINARTKIKFKCLNNNSHEWFAKPKDILKGSGCPMCSKSGYKNNKPGYVYLGYFKNLDLYKIGKSNSMYKRISEFGYNFDLIIYRYFDNGTNATVLEREWLDNVKQLKVNTGLLISGNTETFRLTDA